MVIYPRGIEFMSGADPVADRTGREPASDPTATEPWPSVNG